MGLATSLMDFHIGETVRVSVKASERSDPDDPTTRIVLDSPATATMSVHIALTTADLAIHVFNTTPEITLTDEGTAEFTVVLPASTIPTLEEGVTYRFDIYTTSSGGDILHQAGGAFKLKPAVDPV